MRSVTSPTAAPARRGPSWRRAGFQQPRPRDRRRSPLDWAFVRARHRSRRCGPKQPPRTPRSQPAESARTTTRRRTSRGVVAAVTACDLSGQLGDRLVEDGQVVRVVLAVALPGRSSAQRLAGRVGEAEHGVEAVAALVGGAGAFFVLGVHVDERGVDVEDDGVGARRSSLPSPHLGAHLGSLLQCGASRRSDLVERPKHRRVRGTAPKSVVLDAQVLDVAAALAAAGEHQHLDEDLAPVVQRQALTGGSGMRADRESPSPSRSAKAPARAARRGRRPGPAGFHHDARRALVAHLGSALLVGLLVRRQPQSFTRRAFSRIRGVSSGGHVKNRS